MILLDPIQITVKVTDVLLLMDRVYQDNLQAVRFYRKSGFVRVGEFMPTWANAKMSDDMMITL